MNLSIKNRIALHYSIATALAVAIVFALVFYIVRTTVLLNIDATLSSKTNEHISQLTHENDSFSFNKNSEVRPEGLKNVGGDQVFVQLINQKGRAFYRSPNLLGLYLIADDDVSSGKVYTKLSSVGYLRQLRSPVYNEGKLQGHILTAVSLEPSLLLFEKLWMVLLLSYPVIVLGLFLVSRYLAGKSIKPVIAIRDTADRITKDSWNQRVPLPAEKDEIHDLSVSINELLQRVEETLLRERQFSSYVSHELRTPLSVLRGTLEVLIRKPRTQLEYEQKVSDCLLEVDRLTEVMEQLLVLARADGAILFAADRRTPISDLVEELLAGKALEAQLYGVELSVIDKLGQIRLVPQKHVTMILSNLIGNAIKYGADGKRVVIELASKNSELLCRVTDRGAGITPEDLPHIFKPFFRSQSMNTGFFKGNGLGLAIAQKTAQAIGSEIKVDSKVGKGSAFTLVISDYSKKDIQAPKLPASIEQPDVLTKM